MLYFDAAKHINVNMVVYKTNKPKTRILDQDLNRSLTKLFRETGLAGPSSALVMPLISPAMA